MRCQAVVGVQQLHAARCAVGKAAVGRVPRGFIRRAAKKLGTEIAAEQIIVYDVFVVAEITEFIVLCLKEKHVIKAELSVSVLPSESVV